MKQKYVIPLIIIVLLILGALLWISFSTKSKISVSFRTDSALPKEVIVKLDKNGFSPKEVTIKTGTSVRWENISGDKQTVNSDDYPNNQLHRELNFGVFNNGSSVTYIFTRIGTYGYHNQLHHEQSGEIIVTK